MSGPTSNERSTASVPLAHYQHQHQAHDPASAAIAMVNKQHADYQTTADSVAAAVLSADVKFNPHSMYQQQQQQHHHQQLAQAAAHLQQQHHHPEHYQQQLHHQQQLQQAELELGGVLQLHFTDNEIIKTFALKPELVKYVKNVLNDEEQCKIVINSLKPKAVYFQCERLGSFRTTVKDLAKRQRVAYTKRSKCGYRLVANLYPPEKDKKRTKKDDNVDYKLSRDRDHLQDMDPEGSGAGMWILRMIHPTHNHPPEPTMGGLLVAGNGLKKKRSKYTRTLVEKPLNRGGGGLDAAYGQNEMLDAHHQQQLQQLQHQHQLQQQHHHHQQHLHGPSVQDVAVIAAIEGTPSQGPQVDPNIDPNVDPSVQDHDHAHGGLR